RLLLAADDIQPVLVAVGGSEVEAGLVEPEVLEVGLLAELLDDLTERTAPCPQLVERPLLGLDGSDLRLPSLLGFRSGTLGGALPLRGFHSCLSSDAGGLSLGVGDDGVALEIALQ